MTESQLIDALIAAGIKVQLLNNDQIKITVPDGPYDKELLEKLRRQKSGVVEYLKKIGRRRAGARVLAIEEQEYYKLSNAQQRVWLKARLSNQESIVHNSPLSYKIKGLDKNAFAYAFRQLIHRHEILRTTFITVAGQPRQKVHDSASFYCRIGEADLRCDPDQEQSLNRLMAREINARFDLGQGPLVRATLVQVEDDEHVFLLVMHHIVMDGWSLAVIVNELLALYQAYCLQREDPLPQLQLQYKDFVHWQHRAITQEDEAYWLGEITGDVPRLALPSDFPRGNPSKFNGGQVRVLVPARQVGTLRTFATARSTSLSTVVYSVFSILLARLSNQPQFLVGVANANRNHLDLEHLVGFFVNTLLIRNTIDESCSFEAYVDQVTQRMLNALQHQNYPVDLLVEKLNPERTADHQSFFNVVFSFQNFGDLRLPAGNANDTAATLRIEAFRNDFDSMEFDLVFTVMESDGGLWVSLRYDKDAFSAASVERWAGMFMKLVAQVCDSMPAGRLRLADLSVLAPDEHERLVNAFNDNRTAYPRTATVPGLFREVVAKHGDKPALQYRGKVCTYQELEDRSNQVANLLHQHQVQTEDRVLLLMDPSDEAIAILLGILKAGGAYVFINPDYPVRRINYIAEDTGARIIFSEKKYLPLIGEMQKSGNAPGTVVYVDDEADLAHLNGRDTRYAPPVVTGDCLAYITYTSGSTGYPKGVLVEHRGVVRLVRQTNYIDIRDTDTVAQTAPIAFDASTFEIWGALLNGAKLHLLDPHALLNAKLLRSFMRDNGITICWLTSSLFNRLADLDVEIFAPLRTLLVGGEALSAAHVNKVLGAHKALTLINGYGPTENTTFSSCWPVEREYAADIPIGRPVANSQCYVLDDARRVQPIGVVGELFVGGDGLARGYLNAPELTHAKFIRSPFGGGERLYSTGDQVRWTEAGILEYKGRRDQQVKIRGFRIELKEVEAVIKRIPGVREAVVVEDRDQDQEKYLQGYFTSPEHLSPNDVRKQIAGFLPAYMVPAQMLQVDAIPLLPNGKADHRALRNLRLQLKYDLAGDIQLSSTETTLRAIWENMLDRKNIRPEDDFFELGGHSLKAVMVAALVSKELGIDVDMSALFKHTTIRALGRALDAQIPQRGHEAIPGIEEQAHYPLSHAQKRLWVLEHAGTGTSAYNMGFAFLLRGADYAVLAGALQRVVARHEILRTVFKVIDGEPRQRVLPPDVPFRVPCVDLGHLADGISLARESVKRDADTLFDLENGPLLRAKLIRVDDHAHVLFLGMHHIIADGWSMDVLFKEIASSYNAILTGEPLTLDPLAVQYKDFTVWQNKQLSDDHFSAHRQYWLDTFRGDIPVLPLTTDRPRPARQTYHGDKVSIDLEPALCDQLKAMGVERSASLFMLLLASVKTFLLRYTGQEDIVVGTVTAGRSHVGLNNQIGYYLNTLPLRTRLSGRDTFLDAVGKVRKATLDAFNHEGYPFDKLVRELALDRDPGRFPLFDVLVALQNAPDASASYPMHNVQVSAFDFGATQHSKFDLSFIFSEQGPAVTCAVEYNTDLFDPNRIERLARHYLQFLRAVLASPEAAVAALAYTTGTERRQLVQQFCGGEAVAVPNSFIETFEQRVAAHPQRAAIRYQDRSISYEALNAAANKVANHFRQQYGIRPDDLVGVMVERSPELIIALLAILKCRAAFVALETAFPRKRMEYMLSDTGIGLLVTGSDNLFNLDFFQGNLFCIDLELPQLASSAENPAADQTENPLAYVLYTSGTTGTPKGVQIGAASLMNYLQWANKRYLGDLDKAVFAVFSPVTFDLTLTSIFAPLAGGHTLRIFPHHLPVNEVLSEVFGHGSDVAVVKLTPSHLDLLNLLDLPETDVKNVIVGGEALLDRHVQTLRKLNPSVKIFNEYGPTETTIGCTVAEVLGQIHIGRPIDNTNIYILDADLQLAAVGVPGEICIGGAAVGEGYLNRAELTQQKFIAYAGEDGRTDRLYRSGDMGYWTPGGDIRLMGRKDAQVKVRGFRIETAEVERVLVNHPAVALAHVYVTKDATREPRLSAAIHPTDDQAFTLNRLLHLRKHNPKAADKLYQLPNGMVVCHNNKNETDLVYFEIFEDLTYLKYGIEINAGDVVVDVGANIGLFSLFVGNHFPGTKIYSFEPVAPVYEVLKVNLSLYDIQATPFNAGMGDKREKVTFQYYPNNTVLSGRFGSADEKVNVKKYVQNRAAFDRLSISDDQIDALIEERVLSEEVECELTALSDFIREQSLTCIDLLKIDAEKSELNIIRGIREEDWRKIKQVLIEVHDIGDSISEIEFILRAQGFQVQRDQDDLLQGTDIYNLYASRKPLKDKHAVLTPAKAFNANGNWTLGDALINELKAFCKDYLPEYMIPSQFVLVDHIPLTANGKLDLKAIGAMETPQPPTVDEGYATWTHTQKVLAAIWTGIVGKQHVKLSDDFFKIGGHSLNSVQLIARIQHHFNKVLSVADVFKHSTLEQLSRIVEAKPASASNPITPIEEQEFYEMSHTQKRIWLSSQLEENRLIYNILSAHEIKGLNVDAFMRALSCIILRHEILRTTFKELNGAPRQFVNRAPQPASYVCTIKLPAEQRRELIKAEAARLFDLENGPLLHVTIADAGNDSHLVVLTMHHIISDGWSLDVFFKEFIALYDLIVDGKEKAMIPLRIHYKDYTAWQKAQLNGEVFERLGLFWHHKLGKQIVALNFTPDFPRPAIQTFNANRISMVLDSELTRQIRSFTRTRDTTLFMMFTSVMYILFRYYTGEDDIIIGTPVGGRENLALENQIGPYINTLPVRFRTDVQADFEQHLKNVRADILSMYDHQAYPFDLMLNAPGVTIDRARSPLFDVGFTWQNTDGISGESAYKAHRSLEIEGVEVQAERVKTDFWFHAWEEGESVVFSLMYNANLYKKATCENLLSDYRTLITQLILKPGVPVEDQLDGLRQKKLDRQSAAAHSAYNSNLQKLLQFTTTQKD